MFLFAVTAHRRLGGQSCYNLCMPSKRPTKTPTKRSGRRGDPVRLAPLTMDQAVDAIFQIKPDDVKKIVASKPGKSSRSKDS